MPWWICEQSQSAGGGLSWHAKCLGHLPNGDERGVGPLPSAVVQAVRAPSRGGPRSSPSSLFRVLVWEGGRRGSVGREAAVLAGKRKSLAQQLFEAQQRKAREKAAQEKKDQEARLKAEAAVLGA